MLFSKKPSKALFSSGILPSCRFFFLEITTVAFGDFVKSGNSYCILSLLRTGRNWDLFFFCPDFSGSFRFKPRKIVSFL